MNLLLDDWIPVQQQSKRQLISLQTLLCEEGDWQIALSRDDMELACLQLLVCLTQVVFLPEDKKHWQFRGRTPLDITEYQSGIEPYKDWFDLRHPETPFMQIHGVKSKEPTPIQKLFVGLPEGNNHAFFNDPGEIRCISESAAAIALFNQAMNSPSMGGGFKGGFRGGAPVTTLLSGPSLRQTIWLNVLHKDSLRNILPNIDELTENDWPTWVEPVKEKSKIPAHSIGLLRGLFWQPAHIELQFIEGEVVCDFYGLPMQSGGVVAFKKEKFVYDIQGDWIHPHSPRTLDLKKKTLKYRSFTTAAPAWMQLNYLVVRSEDKKEGHFPAEVVNQFPQDSAKASLLVGGYRNKQASILQRRHELFPLSPGWEKSGAQLAALVEAAKEVKTLLRNKLYGFAKETGAANVHEQAEAIFYQRSEPLIHQTLRHIDWAETPQRVRQLRQDLISLSWEIFEQVTQPYRHEPKMLHALVVSRKTLGAGFKKLQGDAL